MITMPPRSCRRRVPGASADLRPGRALRHALSLTLGLTFLAATLPARADEELTQRIRRYAEAYDSAGQLSGQLLVARAGEVLVELEFGEVERDDRLAVSSITKPLTIALTALLEADGKLSRNDALARWLPEFPHGDQLQVKHLLYHRAGLPHRVTTPDQENRRWTAAEVAALVAEIGPQGDVPAKRSYSSAGYAVLARVLERAGGASYAELLQERILKPAGVEGACDATSDGCSPTRASFTYGAGGELVSMPEKDYSFLVGGGSWIAGARDVLRVQRAVVDGLYGSAVRTALLRLGEMSWNGSSNGYRAVASYDQDSDVSVVLVGNLSTGAINPLLAAAARLASGEEVAPAEFSRPEFVTVEAQELERVAGTYALQPTMALALRGGVLWANEWPLVPVAPAEGEALRLHSVNDHAVIVPVWAADGPVEAIDWRRGGRSSVSPRVEDR